MKKRNTIQNEKKTLMHTRFRGNLTFIINLKLLCVPSLG